MLTQFYMHNITKIHELDSLYYMNWFRKFIREKSNQFTIAHEEKFEYIAEK